MGTNYHALDFEHHVALFLVNKNKENQKSSVMYAVDGAQTPSSNRIIRFFDELNQLPHNLGN